MATLALLRRPRSLLLWKVSFQLHLWLGILLTLYVVLIGATGSLLVFRTELEALFGVHPWPTAGDVKIAVSPEQVIGNLGAAFPGRRVLSLVFPDSRDPWFLATVQGRGQRLLLRIDPQTGSILDVVHRKRSWIDVLVNLHTTWLLGREGRVLNGVGGILLLLINITGLVVWWPGTRLWRRGLTVDLRRNWRRINFDLHRAVGFWTVALLCCWAVSGIYFAWPQQIIKLTNRISPIISAQPPVVVVRPAEPAKPPSFSNLIAKARRTDPGTTLEAIHFPYSRRAPFEVKMRRRMGEGREYADIVYLSPLDGSHLKTWRYGVNESLGDWFIWLQVPLHFGTYWGIGVKILWAAVGAGAPMLAISGVMMYWNRFLRHRRPWK